MRGGTDFLRGSRRTTGRGLLQRRYVLPLLLSLLLLGCSPAGETTDEAETPPDDGAPEEAGGDPEPEAEEEEERVSVTMGVPTEGLDFYVYMYAIDGGFFEEEGLDVEVQMIGGSAGVPALVSGDLDFMAAGGSAQRAALEGLPVRLIYTSTGAPTSSVFGQPELESFDDLRGGTIGISTPGATPDVTVRAMLEAEGIDPDTEVEIITMQEIDRVWVALQAGAVDAGPMVPPFDAMAAAEGFSLLGRAADYIEATQGGVAASVEKIEEERDLVKRFLRAVVRTHRAIRDEPDAVIDWIAERYNLERDAAEISHDNIVSLQTDDGIPTTEALRGPFDEPTDEEVAQTADFGPLEEVIAELDEG